MAHQRGVSHDIGKHDGSELARGGHSVLFGLKDNIKGLKRLKRLKRQKGLKRRENAEGLLGQVEIVNTSIPPS